MTEENKTENSAPLEEEKKENIIDIDIQNEMKSSYLDYAMSVIVSRALPDVRDGLKPVHRRILYGMHTMGMTFNKPTKKCARIVGEVLGKYHPHGDSSVYDALVRMAQDFSLRYPLIDGQGNFGSIDGDRAAAMRYTEARLKKISNELLQDIDKETVNFVPNFDTSLKEPEVLPAKLPGLLINGASGIAVGMATNIPPHNITELIDGIIELINNPEIEVTELFEIIKGPDFPTGGIICGKRGILQAYSTGRGKIKVKSKTHIEETKGRRKIVIDEIPYQVNKALLITQIADCVKDKVIEGISDLRDESDKDGMRIVIELKNNANSDVVLNQLMKHTRCQGTYGINMLALVNHKPETLPIKRILELYLAHREDVIRKRTEFDLKKAEKRAHILKGLRAALDKIDKVIALIKASKNVEEARNGLIDLLTIDDIQANAILDMQLSKLTNLEQEKLTNELNKLKEIIKELQAILDSRERILDIIKTELQDLKGTYSDDRKTQIIDVDDDDLEIEDLIKPEEMVVTITKTGYIKRVPLEEYKQQKRGGKGIIATHTKDDDFVETIFVGNTHDYILFFTDKGKVQWLKVFRLPMGSRIAKGVAIVNLLELDKDEKVQTYLCVKEFDPNMNIIFATKKGIIKKSALSDFSRPRKGGIIAINLSDDDKLINVLCTNGEQEILLGTENGRAVHFRESDVRTVGRNARGVRGIKLKPGDNLVGMVIINEDSSILTVTENGYGKRTNASDYRITARGGSGVINIKTTSRNGNVAAIKSVIDDDELMLISRNGVVIRTRADGISVIGRNTQGVRLMNMKGEDKVMDVAKIASEDDDIEEEEAPKIEK